GVRVTWGSPNPQGRRPRSLHLPHRLRRLLRIEGFTPLMFCASTIRRRSSLPCSDRMADFNFISFLLSSTSPPAARWITPPLCPISFWIGYESSGVRSPPARCRPRCRRGGGSDGEELSQNRIKGASEDHLLMSND